MPNWVVALGDRAVALILPLMWLAAWLRFDAETAPAWLQAILCQRREIVLAVILAIVFAVIVWARWPGPCADSADPDCGDPTLNLP